MGIRCGLGYTGFFLFRGLPALNAWGHDHGVAHIFTDPGCPTQNGYIESFNGKLRDECLNQNWLSSLSEAASNIEEWRLEYNKLRPHSSLGNLTSEECALKISSDY